MDLQQNEIIDANSNSQNEAQVDNQNKLRNWNEIKDEEEIRLSQTVNNQVVNNQEQSVEEEPKALENEFSQEFEINVNGKVEKIPSKGEGDLELIVEHQIITEPEFIAPIVVEEEVAEDGFIHAKGDYDPKADLSGYVFPEIDLLEKHGNDTITINNEELQANKDRILDTLKNYSIEIEKIKANNIYQ